MRILTSYEIGDDQDGAIGDSAASEYAQAQSFTIPSAATILKIGFYGRKSSITDDLTWRVETNSVTIPSGTLVNANATGVITAAEISGSNAWNEKTLANIFSLRSNTTYWLTFSVPAQSNNIFYAIRQFTAGTYANGNNAVNTNGGGWVAASAVDCLFRIYGNLNGSLIGEI